MYTLKYNIIIYTYKYTYICTHITHIPHNTQRARHTHTNTQIYNCSRTTHMAGQGVHTHTLRSQVCGNRSGFREAQCQGNLSTHTQGPHNAKPIGPDQQPIRSDDVNQDARTYVRYALLEALFRKNNPGIGNMVSLPP